MSGDQGGRTDRGIPRRRFLGVVGAGAALAALPAGYAARQAGAVVPPDAAGLIAGVAASFARGASSLPDHLPQLQSAGIGYIREGFEWRSVEYSKGQYRVPDIYDTVVNEANRKGVKVLARLGGTYQYGHPAYGGGRPTSNEALNSLARCCAHVVRHFGSRVRLYELWNEWDINHDPNPGPSPADLIQQGYVDMAKAVYPAMKQAAREVGTEIKLIGPAFTDSGVTFRGHLEGAVKRGLLNHVDGVSFHMYNHQRQNPEHRTAEAGINFSQATQDMLKINNGGKSVPIYITEQGQPTPPGSTEFTERSQAQYLARTYLLAHSLPYVEGVWWYNRKDWITSNNYPILYGLRRADDAAKPSYTALSVMQKALRGYRYDRRLMDLGSNHNPNNDHVLRFTNTTKASTLAAWTTGYDHDVHVPFDSGTAEVTEMLGGKAISVTTGGKLTLRLTQSPKYVSVPLSSETTAGSLVYETELLPVRAKSADAHVIIPEDGLPDPRMSGGRGTRLAANSAGDYVTYTVNVPLSGTYGVRIKAKRWNNRGKFQTSVDGIARGAVQDLYAPSIQYVTLDLGSFYIPGGNRAFEFKVVGKNAAGLGYELGLDAIILDQA